MIEREKVTGGFVFRCGLKIRDMDWKTVETDLHPRFLCAPLLRCGVHLTNGSKCWQIVTVMSITVQLDLPEEVVREARSLGLLETRRMTAMLAEEVRRRRAGKELKEILDEL